ncbi:MAG: hypothetical protein JKY61_05480 [Planctomycetes bacterium]|nr:hypothetical protein [Planctomycetota bacterium]
MATHFALADDSGIARFGLDVVTALKGRGYILSGLEWETDAFLGLTESRIASGRVVFYVPFEGSLGVELADEEGARWSGGERVYAQGESWRRYSSHSGDGWYWMHGLPFGEDFSFYILERGEDVGVEQSCLPLRQGEGQRRVRLSPRAMEARVHGQVLGKAGNPIRASWLIFDLQGSGPVPVLTDAKGQFELVLPEEGLQWMKAYLSARHDPRVESKVVVRSFLQDQGAGAQGAWVRLPSVKRGQDADLGVIELLESPVLVAGRIRIKGGTQEVTGEVRVFELAGSDNYSNLAIGDLWKSQSYLRSRLSTGQQRVAAPKMQAARGGPGLWLATGQIQPDPPVSGTDPEEIGQSFQISGVHPALALRLEFHVTGTVDFEPYVAVAVTSVKTGDRGLDIELVRAAQVRGSVIAEEPKANETPRFVGGMEAVFLYGDGAERRLPISRKGEFSGNLVPGEVGFSIVRRGVDESLFSISSLNLQEGADQDGRLVEIRLKALQGTQQYPQLSSDFELNQQLQDLLDSAQEPVNIDPWKRH